MKTPSSFLLLQDESPRAAEGSAFRPVGLRMVDLGYKNNINTCPNKTELIHREKSANTKVKKAFGRAHVVKNSNWRRLFLFGFLSYPTDS
jgi:hypothetical protein